MLKNYACSIQRLNIDGEWMEASFYINDLDEAKKTAKTYSKDFEGIYKVMHKGAPVCVYVYGEVMR